jgi:hypothetical protein
MKNHIPAFIYTALAISCLFTAVINSVIHQLPSDEEDDL